MVELVRRHQVADRTESLDLGAELIVAVGTHSSMVDFLDKGRAGMASTVLTRMKVGPILVDAKGVIRHVEIVPEVTTHPNYDAALAAAKKAAMPTMA